MKRTSRVINILLGGRDETVCARVLRAVDSGSKTAKVVEFLINTAFLVTINEINHVRGYDETY